MIKKNSWPVIILSIMLMGSPYGDGLSALENIATPSHRTDGKVSMDFENANLKSVLKAFSMQTGINFISSDVIENKKVTVFLSDVSVETALASILEANSLLYEKQADNLYLIKPSGKSPMKTVTRIFKLNYLQVAVLAASKDMEGSSSSGITIIGQPAIAEAGSLSQGMANAPAASKSSGDSNISNIVKIIQSLMTQYGKIVADVRNNSLIITDSPNVFAAIEETIKKLDVEPILVMISAEIIETSTSAMKKIGLEYGSEQQLFKATYTGGTDSSGGASTGTSPTFPTPFPFTESFIKNTYGETLKGSGLFNYGTLQVADTEFVLKMLAQDTDTKYLARPRIMTLNNETALIKVSANTAIGINTTSVTQTSQVSETAERAETGVVLRVTPQVNDKQDIFMHLEPSVSRAVASTLSPNFYNPSYRSSVCTLMVRDMETVVVAGLIQTDVIKTVRKVPFLGDLPWIGEAFTSRYNKVEDTEIVIFITPHIVKKRDAEYITAKNMTDRDYVMQNSLTKHTPGSNEKLADAKARENAVARALRNYSAKGSSARKEGFNK